MITTFRICDAACIITREHPSESKDRQKRFEWASALKRDQLRKEQLEGQQPSTTGSEPMFDEPTTSQQAGVAGEQQKPQRTVREYKIPYRRHGRPRTPPEEWYPSVPTAPIMAQIQPRTTDETHNDCTKEEVAKYLCETHKQPILNGTQNNQATVKFLRLRTDNISQKISVATRRITQIDITVGQRDAKKRHYKLRDIVRITYDLPISFITVCPCNEELSVAYSLLRVMFLEIVSCPFLGLTADFTDQNNA
uniref:Uncharacterized protein n=1 Tax=Romanomermis culicivorax TaxID=13658 RepID=A0A915J1F1_ROMCU